MVLPLRRLSAALLALALAGPVAAQTVGYNIQTGDVWLDTRIGEVDRYGRQYRDPFIGELVSLGAPRPLVVELLDSRGWSPGDIYLACTMASVLGIECLQVVERRERNPGHGWGRLARDLGIQPGSAEFHALKRGTLGSYERWGYPITLDSDQRVEWSDGPQGRGRGRGQDTPAAGGRGAESGAHPGRGNRGRGQDKRKD